MEVENFTGSAYTGSKAFTQQHVKSANATGFGAAADDYMERGIDLNEQLIRNKPATFFMKVKSDSMMNAGIFNGDILIVDRSLKVLNGKIIIAILDGEMLLRRYEKTFNKCRLLSDSPKIHPVEVNEMCDFKVWGVVTCVMRVIE